jgi:hypothetical protein
MSDVEVSLKERSSRLHSFEFELVQENSHSEGPLGSSKDHRDANVVGLFYNIVKPNISAPYVNGYLFSKHY